MPPSRKYRRVDDDQSWREIFREYAVYSQAGLMFPTAVAVGLLCGYLLDGWLATSPWLTLAGVALGVAAAIVNLYRTLDVEDRRDAMEERRRGTRGRRPGNDPDGRGRGSGG